VRRRNMIERAYRSGHSDYSKLPRRRFFNWH
jgi:hypothetical protein